MGDPPLVRIMPGVVVWASRRTLADKRGLELAATNLGVDGNWYISGCQTVYYIRVEFWEIASLFEK